MLQLHKFDSIVKSLLVDLAIDKPLLFGSHEFIIVVILLLGGLSVFVIGELLLGFIISRFRLQLLLLCSLAVRHDLGIILNVDFSHSVRVGFVVLLTLGVCDAIESLLACAPVLFRLQYILALFAFVRLGRRRICRVLRLLLLLLFLYLTERILLDVLAIDAHDVRLALVKLRKFLVGLGKSTFVGCPIRVDAKLHRLALGTGKNCFRACLLLIKCNDTFLLLFFQIEVDTFLADFL